VAFRPNWPVFGAAVLSGVVAVAILGAASLDGGAARSPHGRQGGSRNVIRASLQAAIAKIASPPNPVAIAAVKPAPPAPGGPLDFLRITSDFGMRLHPILGLVRMHEGVDFGAAEGAPVLAAADGVVTDAGPDGGYGNMLHIRHAGGWATGYAHLSAFAPGIAPGARVTAGEVIAFVGHTGLATGPHLHFEVSRYGDKVDPMSTLVSQVGTPGLFRWTSLIGQSRAIDLAYRNRQLLSRNDHGLGQRPQLIVPAESITTAEAGRDQAPRGDERSHIVVSVHSTAQAQPGALLTFAPAPISDKQSFFEYAQRPSNRLPIPGSQ
jgi:hypothetical protein